MAPSDGKAENAPLRRAEPAAHASGLELEAELRTRVIAATGHREATMDPVDHVEPSVAQLPAALVRGSTAQVAVAVVAAAQRDRIRSLLDLEIERPGPAARAETAPHFRRVLPVDLDPIVGGRRALAQPLGAGSVARGTGVYEHALPGQRKLEGERIRMGVTREMRRADLADVGDQYRGAALQRERSRSRAAARPRAAAPRRRGSPAAPRTRKGACGAGRLRVPRR